MLPTAGRRFSASLFRIRWGLPYWDLMMELSLAFDLTRPRRKRHFRRGEMNKAKPFAAPF